MKEYNALFIIDPEKEASFNEITSVIKDAIVKGSGKVDKEENWGKQRIAHPVNKKEDGLFYKLEFSTDPSEISNLNSTYKLNGDILRVMITSK